MIERAVILANGPILKVTLPNDLLVTTMPPKSPLASLEEVERDHILQVLEACGWRVRGQGGGAAAILGLNPTTLESRMNKLGIRRPFSSLLISLCAHPNALCPGKQDTDSRYKPA